MTEQKPTVASLAEAVEEQGKQIQNLVNGMHGIQGSVDSLLRSRDDAQGDEIAGSGVSARDVLTTAQGAFHAVLNPTVLKAGFLILLIELFSDGDPAGANDSQAGQGVIEELLQAILSVLG